jgi:UDP-GlcNAc:undecaprenyl-phosphate/decaprenyl-phosphate GlcNAc-1-phosphate transferase
MGVPSHTMPMVYPLYLIAFIVAIGFAVAFTYVVRNFALARGWAKGPASERHIHTAAMPRVGGVAIYLVVVGASAGFLTHLRLSGEADAQQLARLSWLLAPATVVFLAGLYDDFRSAGPVLKLGSQAVAGALLYAIGFRFSITPQIIPYEMGGAVTLLLTVLWTVLITNSFNLIDGVDGLAAGSALFSTLSMFTVALALQNSGIALLTAIVAGATVGFLRFNFSPATIFLGDCGSQFLGFVAAALSLAGVTQQKSSTVVAVAIPVIAFGFPIVETTISVLRRVIAGQPIFGADREHMHHQLIKLGFSQRSVFGIACVVSAVFGLLSLLLLSPGSAPIAIVLTVVGIGLAFGIHHLRYHEFFEIGRIARRTLEQGPIIVNNLRVRRASEQISAAGSFREVRKALRNAFEESAFDGFEVHLESHASGRRLMDAWEREGAAAARWSMTVDLVDGRGERYGDLTLKRAQHTQLYVDIDLIAAELAPGLVSAAKRILEPATVASARAMVAAATGEA